MRRGSLDVLELAGLGAGVDAVVTTRRGGVSAGPYRSLNLGDHVGDDPACVAENRRRLADAMGEDEGALVIARQVHGHRAAVVRRGDSPGDADALVTTDPTALLVVLVADCVPIVLHDPVARVLALVHAGWRGTVAGVVARAVGEAASLGAVASRCTAVLGPCISGRSYEVGAEVAEAFERCGRGDAVERDATGRATVDLHRATAAQLLEAGLDGRNVTASSWSTDGGTTFFSDRAQRPCGRFAVAARLTGAAP